MRLRQIVLLLALTSLIFSSRAEEQPTGAPAIKCAHDEELIDNKCFERCRSGFEAEGPVCIQVCPSNSQDWGDKCLMGPAAIRKKSYTREPRA